MNSVQIRFPHGRIFTLMEGAATVTMIGTLSFRHSVLLGVATHLEAQLCPQRVQFPDISFGHEPDA
jgi:hypothetical protein